MRNDTETLTVTDFLLARLAERDLFWEVVGEAKQAHPDRVRRHRAETEAMRRIVERFVDADREANRHDGDDPLQQTVIYWQDWADRHAWAEAVAVLASVYSDHPDYRDEWRP